MTMMNSKTSESSHELIDCGASGDHISKLHESITSHILSHLPTKDALRTCVLSKDWRYKWTSIYNISIDDLARFTRGNHKETDFLIDFMERILHLKVAAHHVRSFRLVLTAEEYYDISQMTTWVLPILGPNLKKFMLHYVAADDITSFVIPQGLLLNCRTSLKELSLLGCILNIPPTVYNFPNLKCLGLCRIDILNEKSDSHTMILNFPVLKTLLLAASKWLNVKCVEIHAPKLEEFILRPRPSIGSGPPASNEYSIKILGATIVRFDITHGLQDNLLLTGSTVVSVALTSFPNILDMDLPTVLKVQTLFKELSNVTKLDLSGSILEGFVEFNAGISFPRYEKLEKIQISDQGGRHDVILELLQATPNLKFIGLDMSYWYDFDYDEVQNIPYCVASSLEEVRVEYSCYWPEPRFDMERFILKFGARLKTIHLSVSSPTEYFYKLSSFPTASPSLSICIEYKT